MSFTVSPSESIETIVPIKSMTVQTSDSGTFFGG